MGFKHPIVCFKPLPSGETQTNPRVERTIRERSCLVEDAANIGQPKEM